MVGDAQHAVDVLDELDHADDLVLDLIRRAEDVRVVQVHPAHARQAAQLAGFLVAPHRAELGNAQRQLAIAVLLVLVDLDVVRAVHRPQDELLIARLHDREHRVLVVVPVAGGLVHVDFGGVGRDDVLVAAFELQVRDPAFQLASDGGALRQPERQAGADQVREREELELLADAPVVASLGVLDRFEVVLELVLGLPGRAVDALEHRALLVAAPVRARDVGELERADLAGFVDVRAAAQVDPVVARPVEADRLVFGAGPR